MTGLDRALRLAARGVPVFPCRSKAETIKGKLRKAKSPITPHWRDDATTNEAQIRAWWHKRPDALIGVPTGEATGIFAIDVDPDGIAWYERNKRRLGEPRVHRTKRGGFHLLYAQPRGRGVTVGVEAVADGVDHRGDGGYIIYWPAHGFEIEHKVALRKLNQVPDWLIDALTEPKKDAASRKPKVEGDATPIEEGKRNDALARLAGRMRRTGASQAEIEKALLAYNEERCEPPLDDDEVRTIAESIARYEPVSEDRRHDWGNAERLAAFAKDLAIYDPRQRVFYVWDDFRWRVDHGEHKVSRLAVESARKLLDDALASPDLAEQKKLLDWGRTSLNENRIKGAVELTKNFETMHVEAARLDSDPFLLGVMNGTVDLRTGKMLKEPRREDLITKVAGCEFDPEAVCPSWRRFLDEIMDGDAEMIAYLQELVGYTLSGDTSGHMLMFLYGTGQNGKSVFIEVVRDVLGEYGMSMRTDALSLKAMSSKNGASEDIARLAGARMVAVNETAEGMRFDESLIKDLTGEDTVAARFLYKGTFEYRPVFKIWIRGNHQPEFNGADGGMARRVRLIPFDVRIPDSKVDPHLKEKLRTELPGVLNWAIEGALRWQKVGRIETPEKVLEATNEYVTAMDGLAEFFDEVLIRDEGSQTPIAVIFSAYEDWARFKEGIRFPLTKHKLALRLKGRGLKAIKFRVKGKPTRGFLGVRVKGPFSQARNELDDLI